MSNYWYRASVEVFQRRLEGLAHYLGKGIEFAAAREMKDENFLGARLHADMLPLVAQIRIATDHAKGGAGRLAGVELPVFEDNETTIADLQGRVAKAQKFLATLKPPQFEGVDTRRVSLKLMGKPLEFAAPAYLLHFAIPNFYFHQVTAYAILRGMGVKIGKQDYMGHPIIHE
jgi:hypothetical protein